MVINARRGYLGDDGVTPLLFARRVAQAIYVLGSARERVEVRPSRAAPMLWIVTSLSGTTTCV